MGVKLLTLREEHRLKVFENRVCIIMWTGFIWPRAGTSGGFL